MFDIVELGKSGILRLLKAEGKLQQQLFAEARRIRYEIWGDEVFFRGAIEISNHCQKNCNYCAMRCTNKNVERYRLTSEQILSVAEEIRKLNITKVFLQSGQDPEMDRVIHEVLPQLKKDLNLEIILCVGERSRADYEKFHELGADGYVVKFETSDAALYKELAHTSSAQRLQCIRWIKEVGMKAGTGNMVGLPNQTLESIADDILLAVELESDFASVSPFIANQDTPLEHLPYGDINVTWNTMALLRIGLEKALIPTVSALEKIRVGGQLMGFHAGANVITVNFTPVQYRQKYPIYAKKRFIVSLEHAIDTIKQAGLKTNVCLGALTDPCLTGIGPAEKEAERSAVGF